MLVLGIETSCDETSAALVEDGRRILSNVIGSQIEHHRPYHGVVPEIASRKHTEWILGVLGEALERSGRQMEDVDGLAVTNRPGLVGSLLVGLSFAKALAFGLGRPFVAVDHVRAHLHAPRITTEIPYPNLGLVVSGGHTLLCRVDGLDEVRVLGTTIDDACGEAFDKVAKHYDLGFPGGAAIDTLAAAGDPRAFRFPDPSLHKGEHRYDVSYSGLKTGVINQLEQFRTKGYEATPANIAASFQKAAIDILLRRLYRAVEDTGIQRVVVGGGVAANSYLRKSLAENGGVEVFLPPKELCGDNAAMIAGLGYEYLARGVRSDYAIEACARTPGFRRFYP